MRKAPYRYAGSPEEYENLLFAYAAGQLNETLSLMVATHIRFCENAQNLVAQMEHVGGALLEAHCPKTELSESCFDALMGKIEAFEKQGPYAPDTSCRCPKTNQAIACLKPHDYGDELIAYLIRSLPTAREDMAAKGLHILHIGAAEDQPQAEITYVTAEIDCYTQRAANEGLEITLILDGEMEDNGVTYPRGALLVADASIQHHQRATGKCRYTCLVFSEHPARILSLLITLLNLML
ncbi:MAG: hypothetical protein AB7E85_04090 [Pseudobdellovibrionaceae bacterium]